MVQPARPAIERHRAATSYRHSRSLTPDEIVARATGSQMTMAPYLGYLRTKYGELYQLPQR